MHLILPGDNPDLDSSAAAYAYTELLNKQETEAVFAVFGEPAEEAEELFEELDIDFSDASYYLYSADRFTLVSNEEDGDFSSRIDTDAVEQVVSNFEGAFSDIEADRVVKSYYSTISGLVTGQFMEKEIEPERETAELLFTAIESSGDVSEPDNDAADWLKERLD